MFLKKNIFGSNNRFDKLNSFNKRLCEIDKNQ